MFCIYQIDDQSNEKITDVLATETDFLNIIKEKINVQFSILHLNSISENDIKTNNCFKDGHYLLISNTQIKLVQKYQRVREGYIYNSYKPAVNVLFTWKLLSFEGKLDDIKSHVQMKEIMDNITNATKDWSDSDTEELFDYMDDNVKKQQFPVEKLDLDDMYANPSICLIGKRGSGKSWIVRNILWKLSDRYRRFEENTLIIAKSEKMSSFYRHNFPKAKILYDYDTDELEEYLSNQQQRITEADNLYKETGIKKSCHGCVVLDDCLASKGSWMNDQVILELFYNSRTYQTTFIMTMQFPLGIKPEFRSCFDYVFLLSEDFYSNQKRLYDHYAGMFPTFEEFRKVLIQLTNDFNCMVLNNRVVAKNISDKVFYFKAEDTN